MTPPTNDQLTAWAEKAEAATPGPWESLPCGCGHPSCARMQPGPGTFSIGSGYEPEDAAWIALGPAHTLALVAEVRRLTAERDEAYRKHVDFDNEASSLKANVDRLEKALRKWTCRSCEGSGHHYTYLENRTCQTCWGSGLNDIARAALASPAPAPGGGK